MAKLQSNGEPWLNVVFDGPEDMAQMMMTHYGMSRVVKESVYFNDETKALTGNLIWTDDATVHDEDDLPANWLLVNVLEWNDE